MATIKARHYRDLIAWQKAFELATLIYKATSDFPTEEKYGLTLQLRRSGISIPSNIAEGEGRKSKKELRHFLFIALGSLNEAETQILISESLGYLRKDQARRLLLSASEVGRLINGLAKTLN